LIIAASDFTIRQPGNTGIPDAQGNNGVIRGNPTFRDFKAHLKGRISVALGFDGESTRR
jgi:hypothetical protein